MFWLLHRRRELYGTASLNLPFRLRDFCVVAASGAFFLPPALSALLRALDSRLGGNDGKGGGNDGRGYVRVSSAGEIGRGVWYHGAAMNTVIGATTTTTTGPTTKATAGRALETAAVAASA